MQKGLLTQACRAAFTAPGDAEFLEEMGERFPRMAENFARFAALKPGDRLKTAQKTLKSVPRTGWLDRGVPPERVESVRDHTENCMRLARLLAGPGEVGHLARMMKVHDLAEALTGDFTPRDKITKPEKHRLELLALNLILEGNPEKDEIIALWDEFERNETSAAHLGHDIDAIDMALTAQGYIRAFPQLAHTLHNEFVTYTESHIRTATGRAFFDSIKDPPPAGLDNPAPRP